MISVPEILLLVFSILYFFIFLFFAIGLVLLKKPKLKHRYSPVVVVAFRNEENNLPSLLESINEQSLKQFQVVFINDHSEDHSVKIIENFIFRDGIEKLILQNINAYGKFNAWKQAFHKIGDRRVITTDADCILSKDWLSEMNTIVGEEKELIFGPVVIYTDNFFSKVQQFDQLALSAASAGATYWQMAFMCSGANLSFYTSDYLNAFENFDSAHGDDVFFLHHKKKRKRNEINAHFSSTTVVKTHPERSLLDFIRQRQRWGSKSIYYQDTSALLVAAIVFLTNTSLCVGLLIFAFHPSIWACLLFSFVLKGSIDFLLLFLAWRRLKLKENFLYFFPSFVFHLCYVPITGILGLLINTSWKGRKNKNGIIQKKG